MRAGALAALMLLGACGVIGPSQTELQAAVREFSADLHRMGVETNLPNLEDATIADLEGCQPLQGAYRCAVGLATSDDNTRATIWVVRQDGRRWSVMNIVIDEEVG